MSAAEIDRIISRYRSPDEAGFISAADISALRDDLVALVEEITATVLCGDGRARCRCGHLDVIHDLARARPGDIVIDYDRLAVALTAEGSDTHNHGRLIKRVTYKAWRAAIREAIDLADRCDVYLIHAIPDPDTLARYTQAGADIVTIDPGRDAVMARIAGQRPADVG